MTNRARRSGRRGLVIIPALVCLAVVTLFCAVLIRQVAAHRRAVRDAEARLRSEWLAESGLSRASAKLAADKGFKGETWDVPAAEVGTTGEDAGGVVRITVDPLENQPARRRVRVEADLPRSGPDRVRTSKTLTIELGPERPGGPS